MVYRNTTAAHVQSYWKSINAVCWKHTEFYNIKAGDTFGNHGSLKDKCLRDYQFNKYKYILLRFYVNIKF
jgi:hypothetical protein